MESEGGTAAHDLDRKRQQLLFQRLFAWNCGPEEQKERLQKEAAELAERLRAAGDERAARVVLAATQPQRSRGRRQEWMDRDHKLLATSIFVLMLKRGLSAHGACQHLADPNGDRSWCAFFDLFLKAHHKSTGRGLYMQFRHFLQSQDVSIEEFNHCVAGSRSRAAVDEAAASRSPARATAAR